MRQEESIKKSLREDINECEKEAARDSGNTRHCMSMERKFSRVI
ncbi:MAG: hypothetical protein MRERC_3c108 [Mycoplasmataceae bacterium RC_NB112A]|nr:MAG: hypothetical protein MRERC_12c050 [Mycoplasmataceae bacterium RC_NB112A]KLL02256.1 MAG: hypothetical protein MRERC_3c108 [Mycoplasmataceae bacterium RC_NB112A]